MKHNTGDERDMTGFVEFCELWQRMNRFQKFMTRFEIKFIYRKPRLITRCVLILLVSIIGAISFEALPFAALTGIIAWVYTT